MARKTKESVRNDIFSSFFSDDNAAREQERVRAELEEQELRREQLALRAQEEQRRQAMFSDVSTSVDTTGGRPIEEQSPLMDILGRIGTGAKGAWDSTVGGGARQLGARMYTDADTESGMPSILGLLPATSIASTLYGAIPAEGRKSLGGALIDQGGQRAQDAYTSMEEAFPVAGGAVADALASPASHASIIGGPVGVAVGGLSAFDGAYAEARRAGMTKEDSAIIAAGEGAIEGGMSAIPTGKYLDNIPGIDKLSGPAKDYLRGRIANILARTAKTGAGEALQEGATEVGQMMWERAVADSGPSAALREYATGQLPENAEGVWERIKRAGLAGFAGGGMIQAPSAIIQDRQMSRQIEDTLRGRVEGQGNLEDFIKQTQEMARRQAEQATPLTRQEQEDAAWAIRADERANEQPEPTRLANQEAMRSSIVSAVDTARDRVLEVESLIEAGDTSSATLNEARSAQRNLERAEARLSSFEQKALAPQQPVADLPKIDIPTGVVGPAIPAEAQAQQAAVREDVRKSIEARQAREQKAKENARKKARGTFINEQLEAVKDLPADQQETAVTRAALQWDSDNPLDTFVPATKPAAKPKAKKQPTVTEEPAVSSVDQLEQMEREFGLNSLTDTKDGSDTTMSSKEVADGILSNMAKGDNRKAAMLLASGKINLVSDASFIPSTAVATNTGAFYMPSTGATYVVASTFEKGKPVVGQLLSRAAHEFKHAGDVSGNADLNAGSLSNLIGVENNDKLVSQIEGVEGSNPVAKRAIERARAATEGDANLYRLELPAYFIEESSNQRNKSSSTGRILRDSLSAVRSGAKRIIPGDYDINLNDVGYLASKLTERAALTEGSLAGTKANVEAAGFDGSGLSMIQGPTSARFKEAKDNGWVYTSMDGKEKFITSDAGSTMNRNNVKDLLKQPNGEGFLLRDMINHKELFTDYPSLQEIPVVIDKTDSLNAAEYNAASNGNDEYISVRSDYVQEALKSRKAMDELRGLILHETQHAVQEAENSARGGNPSMFVTPKDRQTRVKLGNRLRDFDAARQASLDALKAAGEGGFGGNAQLLRDTVLDYNNKNLTMSEVTMELASILEGMPKSEQTQPFHDIVDSVDKIREVQPEIGEMNKRTLADYMDLLGEREARFTEDNLNKTQDQLPRNPEDVNDPTGFVEENIREARRYEGEATLRMSDDDVDASQFTRATARPKLEGLASRTREWAEGYFGDKQQAANFAKWFEGSQVVNEDGTPKVMFHGTYTATDFDTFKAGDNEVGIHVGTSAQANDPAFVGVTHNLTREQGSDVGRTDRAPRIIPLFVSIKNPLRMEDDFGQVDPKELMEAAITAAEQQGLDWDTHPVAEAKVNDILSRYQAGHILEKGNPISYAEVGDAIKSMGFDGIVYANQAEGIKYKDSAGNTFGLATDPASRRYNPYAEVGAQDSYIVFDANQLKSTTGNSGEYSPKQLSFLRSVAPEYKIPALPMSDAPSVLDKTVTALNRVFIPDGGVSNDIAEATRFAHNSQAGMALASDILSNNYEASIASILTVINSNKAEGKKMTNDELRNAIGEDLKAIEDLPTRQERSAAIVKLDQKYPINSGMLARGADKLSASIFAIQTAKRAFTKEIIANRKLDKTPLTEKEVNTFRKMMENDERYVTRTYLATYNQKIGKEYSKRLIKKAQEDPTSDEARKIHNAVNYLVENDLLVPDMETLMRKPIEKVRHMYEAWGLGDASHFRSKEGKQAMAEALQEKVDASREEMESLAMGTVMDMLGLTTKPQKGRKDVLKAARVDRTIVEARKDMPVELRELLGEITDPVLREKLTLHRMGSFVAKSRMMQELHDRGVDKFWSDTQSDLFSEKLGSGPEFGPLAGKYMHPDLQYALSTVVSTHDTFSQELGEAIRNPAMATQLFAGNLQKGMRVIVGTQKMTSVVMNPVNMALNLIGSPLIAAANGVGPVTGVKGFGAAAAALAADLNVNLLATEGLQNIAVEMASAGALDTASVGMLQSDFFKGVQKELRAQIERGETPSILAAARAFSGKAAGTAFDVIRNTYALMDVWTKTATYLNRKDYWTKMNGYESLGLSDMDIKRKAGWDASSTNISYDRAIPLARALEQNTPFAVFATYFAEAMIRVPVMNFIQVGRDLKTAKNAKSPEGRKLALAAATKRLVGTVAVTGGIMLATLKALDSEDDDKKAARALDPEYYRNTIMLQVGTDKEGKPRYYSINRADPLGPLNELVVDVIMAPEDRKLEEFNQGLRDLFITSRAFTDVARLVIDAAAAGTNNPQWDMKGKSSWVKESFPEVFNTLTQFENDGDIPENLMTLIDTFTPTMFKGAVSDERDALGFKPYVRDPEKSMGFRIYDYDKAIKPARRNFQQFLETNPKPEQIMTRMNGILDNERKDFDDLSKALKGFLVSKKNEGKPEQGNFSVSEANALFRNNNLSGVFRPALRGEFQSSVINQRELEKWYKRQLKRKDVDRKELTATYRLALQAYGDLMAKDNNKNED